MPSKVGNIALNVIFLSRKLLICTRGLNNKVQVVDENKNKYVISENFIFLSFWTMLVLVNDTILKIYHNNHLNVIKKCD